MENKLLVNRSWEIQISHLGKWVKTQGADLATLLRLEVVCFYKNTQLQDGPESDHWECLSLTDSLTP